MQLQTPAFSHCIHLEWSSNPGKISLVWISASLTPLLLPALFLRRARLIWYDETAETAQFLTVSVFVWVSKSPCCLTEAEASHEMSFYRLTYIMDVCIVVCDVYFSISPPLRICRIVLLRGQQLFPFATKQSLDSFLSFFGHNIEVLVLIKYFHLISSIILRLLVVFCLFLATVSGIEQPNFITF